MYIYSISCLSYDGLSDLSFPFFEVYRAPAVAATSGPSAYVWHAASSAANSKYTYEIYIRWERVADWLDPPPPPSIMQQTQLQLSYLLAM